MRLANKGGCRDHLLVTLLGTEPASAPNQPTFRLDELGLKFRDCRMIDRRDSSIDSIANDDNLARIDARSTNFLRLPNGDAYNAVEAPQRPAIKGFIQPNFPSRSGPTV